MPESSLGSNSTMTRALSARVHWTRWEGEEKKAATGGGATSGGEDSGEGSMG